MRLRAVVGEPVAVGGVRAGRRGSGLGCGRCRGRSNFGRGGCGCDPACSLGCDPDPGCERPAAAPRSRRAGAACECRPTWGLGRRSTAPPLQFLHHGAACGAHAPASSRDGARHRARRARLPRGDLPHRVRSVRPAQCSGLVGRCPSRRGVRARGRVRCGPRAASLWRAAVQPLPGVQDPRARARQGVRQDAHACAGQARRSRQGRPCVPAHR